MEQRAPSTDGVGLLVTTTEGDVVTPEEKRGKGQHKISKPVEDIGHLGPKNAKTQKPSKTAQQQQQQSQPAPREGKNLTPNELKELKETFLLFDKDKDGFISAKELSAVMRSLGQNPTETEIRDMINEVDTDGNGRLEFEEFVTMMTKNSKTTDEMERELQQSFKIFDINNDGFINAAELKQVMTAIGEKMTEKECADIIIIKQWDHDGNGKIDYREFAKAMTSDNFRSKPQ